MITASEQFTQGLIIFYIFACLLGIIFAIITIRSNRSKK